MAIRPVFIATTKQPFYKQVDVKFEYFSGFSLVQKQKSIDSLHKSFIDLYQSKVLEVSSKSTKEIGVKLSAFNLKIHSSKREFSVESAFQGSKVFNKGGPYVDLLNKPAKSAKKDERLKNSGELIAFRLYNEEYPLEPKDFFYNWIYINALKQNEHLIPDLLNYDAFTDIEFNPTKSINCQARAAAIFVGLSRANRIDFALESKERFLETIYGHHNEEINKKYEQMSLL